LSVTILGLPEFDTALAKRADSVRNATRTAVTRAALKVEREGKKRLRTYTHRPGEATNSPPGQPPALVTGQLRRSWKTEGTPRESGSAIQARTGPTAVYSRVQELGGKCGRGHATTLPARPFLGPSLTYLTDNGELQAEFVAAWTAAWTRLTGV
jgi:phage gpG-like protein